MPDLNVLILEDVEADAELVLHKLDRSGYTVTAVRVQTEKDYLVQLERGPDIILADYSMPQFDGRRALQLLLDRQLDIPFIVITSTISEEVAVDCIKRGAADYLFKDRLGRLGPAIRRAFAERDLRVEKRSAEAALRESEGRFRKVIEAAPDGFVGVDRSGKIILVNTQIEKMFGYRREELLGQPVEILIPKPLRRGHKEHRAGYAADPHVRPMGQQSDLVALHKDGRAFPVEITLGPLATESGLQVLATVRDVTERKRIERALLEAEADYRSLFTNAVEGIYRSVPGGGFLSVNPALARMLGYDSPEQLKSEITNIGKQLYVDAERAAEKARIMDNEGVVRAFETQMLRRDGSRIWISISARTISDSEGNVVAHEGMIEDITERVELRDQVLRSQKMEAIGRLTGGIAHDFNNMLTVITGYTAMLQSKAGSDQARQHLDAVQQAAERSAGLTRQLLAFSRKQIMQPVVLNLNNIVSELDKMLRRIIGENISIQIVLAADLRNVKVDFSRIEQVIVNLVINARDAMPEGGRLTIETSNVELSQKYARSHHDVERGQYVLLAVSDTGIGMDSATQLRIFEPFFTTKGPGKGTGLGLSTVYGIVKQSGGHIWVYSEPGHGTTFKIYLPQIDQPAEVFREPVTTPSRTVGTGTILLVEDEENVRKLTRMILEANGYKVLETSNGAEAFSIAEKRAEPIDLLLTDVVMPGVSGRAVADQCRALHPETRALFMSGYTDNAITHLGILDPGINFIEKPFTPAALVRKIREILG